MGFILSLQGLLRECFKRDGGGGAKQDAFIKLHDIRPIPAVKIEYGKLGEKLLPGVRRSQDLIDGL